MVEKATQVCRIPARDVDSPMRLHDVTPTGNPQAICDCIMGTLQAAGMTTNLARSREVIYDVVDLFEGRWPGYRACNTEYHDLPHTLDVTLTTARLMHGALLSGIEASERMLLLAVTAALFHDTGYIQESWDEEGTGAKHTNDHVRRSMDLVTAVGDKYTLSDTERDHISRMILVTDLSVEMDGIAFDSDMLRKTAFLVAAADLLSQMADRNYLEKLLFLYREFKEAGFGGYHHERHLLEQTVAFYDYADERLHLLDADLDTYIRAHLKQEWGIDRNLYEESLDSQRRYLQEIIRDHDSDHRSHLKRGGIVAAVERKYGNMY